MFTVLVQSKLTLRPTNNGFQRIFLIFLELILINRYFNTKKCFDRLFFVRFVGLSPAEKLEISKKREHFIIFLKIVSCFSVAFSISKLHSFFFNKNHLFQNEARLFLIFSQNRGSIVLYLFLNLTKS